MNDNRLLSNSYSSMSGYYEDKGNFKESLRYYKMFKEIDRVIYEESRDQIISDSIAKYKIDEKEKELVSEKKRYEELKEFSDKLKKSQDEIIRLEKKNSVLAMIVTANHEINQPLTVLSGNIELLQMSLESSSVNLSNQQLNMFERAFESIDKISDILEKYRNTKKISFGFYTDKTEMVFFDGKDKNNNRLSIDEFKSLDIVEDTTILDNLGKKSESK